MVPPKVGKGCFLLLPHPHRPTQWQPVWSSCKGLSPISPQTYTFPMGNPQGTTSSPLHPHPSLPAGVQTGPLGRGCGKDEMGRDSWVALLQSHSIGLWFSFSPGRSGAEGLGEGGSGEPGNWERWLGSEGNAS